MSGSGGRWLSDGAKLAVELAPRGLWVAVAVGVHPGPAPGPVSVDATGHAHAPPCEPASVVLTPRRTREEADADARELAAQGYMTAVLRYTRPRWRGQYDGRGTGKAYRDGARARRLAELESREGEPDPEPEARA